MPSLLSSRQGGADPLFSSVEPGLAIWTDCDEAISQAWDAYLKDQAEKAQELAARALAVAAETIAHEAEKEVADMVVAFRSQSAAHVIRGCAREKSGALNQALQEYERATANPGEGILALLRVLAAQESLVGPRIELSAALTRLDFAHDAVILLEDLRSRVELNDPVLRIAVLGRLGQAYCAVASYDQAIEALTAATEPGPDRGESAPDRDDSWLHGTRGWALQATGKFDEARSAYQSALGTQPHHRLWRRGLADAWHALGDTAHAVEQYQQIIKDLEEDTSGLDADAFRILAWCYNRLGDHEEAFRQIINSVIAGPNLLYNQFDLALIALHLGPEVAYREYQKGVKMAASKPIPRRFGLLREAHRNFEEELRRANIRTSSEIDAIDSLLRKNSDSAEQILAELRGLKGMISAWVKLDISAVQAYLYLSDVQNYWDLSETFRVEADPRAEQAQCLNWTLRGEGIDRAWQTQVSEQSPYSRICYISRPGPNGEREGMSFFTYLIPARTGTLLLVRVVFDESAFGRDEQRLIKKLVDADLERLTRVKMQGRTARSRRSLVPN
jgi:tetratricopeptide (TPR) repeat protein